MIAITLQGHGLMEDADLHCEAGQGQLVIGGWRLDCSYAVTFHQEGRARNYQQISGTTLKTNKEWHELHRHGFRLKFADTWPAELYLADGEIAHGYLRVKDYSPGSPGRSVLRFALLTEKPRKPAA